MILGGSNDMRVTNTDGIGICVYIGQLLVVAASNGVAALISWLIYECSNIIEQSVIPGSSNDNRLPT